MRMSGWMQGVALYGTILGGLALWRFDGIEGAKNVALVAGWVVAIFGLSAIVLKRGDIAAPKGAYRIFEIIAKVSIVLALAWCGFLILSAACIIGWLCIEVARMPREVA